jgi:hypothetical protein
LKWGGSRLSPSQIACGLRCMAFPGKKNSERPIAFRISLSAARVGDNDVLLYSRSVARSSGFPTAATGNPGSARTRLQSR